MLVVAGLRFEDLPDIVAVWRSVWDAATREDRADLVRQYVYMVQFKVVV